jgi:hypothetical protein
MFNMRRWTTVACVVALAATTLSAQSIPKPLKTRLVVGEPVWRELPVRDNLQGQYDRVWQIVLNTVLEHNFDIATMEKSSGYLRTTWNESVVTLKDNWFYKVQISVKMVDIPGVAASGPTGVSKLRIQVTGDVTQVDSKRGLRAYFRGYDQVILQNLFQDLQAKVGSI